MVAGQAAVAVAVSSVQLTSAIASTWNESPEAITAMAQSGKAEERSAFMFFGLSTLFLLACIVMQKWMMTMPVYQEVLSRMSVKKMSEEGLAQDEHERASLVSGGMEDNKLDLTQVIRVAKANWMYEIAVASVFLITLVSA
jgi:solute carrier family 29 (equilibrative nucleoside transporter), member 1/2/3